MAATPAMVEKLLKEKSIAYEDLKDGDYSIKMGEHTVVVSVEDGDLSLKSFFSDKPALKKLNEFNFRYKFGRVCLDSDKDLVLASELDFAGGVSKEGFYSFLDTFQLLLDKLNADLG